MQIRAVRSALAAAALAVLAFPSWPRQVDDTAVSAVYAFQFVEQGRLAWSGDVLVEGYSNFLFTRCGPTD